MDKNKRVEQLDKFCNDLGTIYPNIDIPSFNLYVIEMFVRYFQAKEKSATKLQLQKNAIPLPGNLKSLILACMYISSDLLKYPVSYNDLYSISHVDRNSIRKCERDIRDVLIL